MGVCTVQNTKKERKQNKIICAKNNFHSKKSTKEGSSCFINYNNFDESTDNLSKKSKSNNYILDSNIAIRSDIREKYEIYFNRYLGEGGSGTVYKGFERRSKKYYAFKEIDKSKVKNKNFLINEVKYSLKLKHPNIIKVYEVYENEDYIYLVMDLCENGDLFDYITHSPEGHLDELLSINILIQILKTIDFLHNEAKLCHRDVKPENILISKKSYKDMYKINIKFIDFGFVKKIKEGQFFHENLGTNSYKAPEILNKHYNEKVDLFATGIILYNLITGCEPFRIHSETEIYEQIKNDEIPYDAIKNYEIRKLLKGLCHPDYNKRLSAKQALLIAYEIQKKLLQKKFNYLDKNSNDKIKVKNCNFIDKKILKKYNLNFEDFIDFETYLNIYKENDFIVNDF